MCLRVTLQVAAIFKAMLAVIQKTVYRVSPTRLHSDTPLTLTFEYQESLGNRAWKRDLAVCDNAACAAVHGEDVASSIYKFQLSTTLRWMPSCMTNMILCQLEGLPGRMQISSILFHTKA